MSRFVYKEETVKNAINCLEAAYSTLSQTEAALAEGFNYLQQVQGGLYIDVGENKNTILSFPESGRNYINELKKAVESKCAEIQDYNNAPWYKKLFASVGMGLAKFGEGFLAAFENIGDACVSLVGFAGGLFNKDFQNACGELVKKDLSSSLMSNLYKDGTFIGTYSVFGANSTAANLCKGFGTATGYLVISKIAGKMGGKVEGAINKTGEIFNKAKLDIFDLKSFNVNIGETGMTSIVSGVGGLGAGTETALLQGKSYNEALFQGVKLGAIQSVAAYAAGKLGDEITKTRAESLLKDRNKLINERKELLESGKTASGKTLDQVNSELAKVNKKLGSIADRLEDVNHTDVNHSDAKIERVTNGEGAKSINELSKEQAEKFSNLSKTETKLSGDGISEGFSSSAEERFTNSVKGNVKKLGKTEKVIGEGADDVIEIAGNTVKAEGSNFITKGTSSLTQPMVKAAKDVIANPSLATDLRNMAVLGNATHNTIEHTEAKVQVAERVASLSKPNVQIVPHYETQYSGASNNSTNAAANVGRTVNKSATIANTTYTGHNLNVNKATGDVLNNALKAEREKYTNKINNATTTPSTTTTPVVEPTHNTGSGGRSFGNTSSGSTSTSTPASSLATSIGTIKSTNPKPTTTTTTTKTITTTDSGSKVGGLATGPSTEQPTYQYPTSTTVVGGTSKYPVNRPQIEGSLAQNNVSTTTLGSSGSTHGGGGYSGSGYSFSGSSAVTSDGTIGEQDTKGTLASSITKNKTNKTETIRIAESDDEEVVEEKANNFVIPTSAALSAAAAAGIGAKIIMDKKDKDKEDEQEESDEDYEIISSDFENDFGTDFDDDDDDNNNEYEVVENY